MRRRILLIVPPTGYSALRNYDNYSNTPLEGITSIALQLKNSGYEVVILDARNKTNPHDWIISQIDFDIFFLGITIFFDSFLFIKNLSIQIKEKYPSVPIVIGGPMATAAYKQFLRWTNVDVIVLGEGERTVVELAKRFERKQNPQETPGTARRNIGVDSYLNPRGVPLKDLDMLPPLDWSIYPDLDLQKLDFLYIATRGCSNHCAYCFQIVEGLKSKTPKRIEEDLTYLKENYGMSSVLFTDSDLLNQYSNMKAIMGILHKLDISWGCFAYPMGLTQEKLKKMNDSGCVNLRLGIETFDQDVLNRNSRSISVDVLETNIRTALDSGIPKITGYFVIGLPGDTQSSLDFLVHKVDKLTGLVPRPFYLLTLPGTKVYHDAISHRKIKDEQAYLESLSRLNLEEDDEILINLSNAPEKALRRTFKALSEIAKERTQEEKCPIKV